MFSWVKVYVKIYGNELADRLAKEAARIDGTSYEFHKYPRAPYIMKQQKPNKNGKPNGQHAKTCPQQNSLSQQSGIGRIKINLIPKLAAVLSRHGKTRT
jgi:hypothetical protein